MSRISPAIFAPFCAAFAATLFSINDVAMKLFSGSYALHEIVLIRSVVGFLISLLIMAPLAGGFHLLKTSRIGMHVLRAICIVFANMCFFLGIAAMPLAEAVAIFFISPFLISIFSIIFLGEYVGPRRWFAILVGMIGVLIILRPGTDAFQIASLFPVGAAIGYSGLHIFTRAMRETENAVSMVFYVQIVFLIFCAFLGLWVGDGKYAVSVAGNPSLEFLLRAWVWPETSDFLFFLAIGALASIGGYYISQAYRLGEAAMVAPFEYLALPLSILWGVLFFAEFPDAVSWLGIFLIAGSGLYTVWRENRHAPRV